MRSANPVVLAAALYGSGLGAPPATGAPALQGPTSVVIHTDLQYETRVALTVTPDTQESILRLTADETPTAIALGIAVFTFQNPTGTLKSYREEKVLLFRRTDGTWRSQRNIVLTFNSVLLSFTFDLPAGVGDQVTVKIKTPAGAGLATVFFDVFSNRPVLVEPLF